MKIVKNQLIIYLGKNQFYLSLSRDLTILDCFDNEDLSQIKSELILLGYEYLHDCPRADENEILEEMYMNKLKKIVKPSSKKIENNSDSLQDYEIEIPEKTSDAELKKSAVRLHSGFK